MELRKLAIDVEDERIIDYIARHTGIEGALLSGEEREPGTVALIVRPSRGGSVERSMSAIRRASVLGIPVIVVVGSLDPVGEALAREARACGVPGECLLFVSGGKVVDALGNPVGDALRGTGIGVMVAVSHASHVAQKELVPEPSLWDGEGVSEIADAALWGGGLSERSESAVITPEELADVQADAAQEEREEADQTPLPLQTATEPERPAPWNAYLDRADKVVAVFGVKSGVGVSTIAACLSGILGDHGSLYLEVSPSAVGYVYFGSALDGAVKTGKYAYCAEKAGYGEPPKNVPILIADATIPGAMDAVYERADCVVVVTDGSPVAFGKVEKWVKGGWRVDVLVVNRVVPGTGYPPEVYAGEFNLERVIGIPGGPEEETAINLAQRNAVLPLGKSVDFDAAIGDLAETVLNLIERGEDR